MCIFICGTDRIVPRIRHGLDAVIPDRHVLIGDRCQEDDEREECGVRGYYYFYYLEWKKNAVVIQKSEALSLLEYILQEYSA